MGTMLFLTVVVGVVIWQWRGDGSPVNLDAASTPSPHATASPSPSKIPLPDIGGIPARGTSLLIVVDGKACWRGFVGGTKIEECGKQRIDLTGVPNKIKAGAQLKKNEEGHRLEVYIVHEGEAVAFGDASFAGQLVEVRANLSG